jgi:hypothetical protein
MSLKIRDVISILEFPEGRVCVSVHTGMLSFALPNGGSKWRELTLGAS